MAKPTFLEYTRLRKQDLTFSIGTSGADASSVQISIEENGGDYGAGLIKNVVLAQVGYAIGWGWWVEQSFIEAVVALAAEKKTGLKCRFQHPKDGILSLGSAIGKIKNVRVEGDKAVGDLHIQKASTKSPLGDLRDYILTYAAESPEDFGLSIYGRQGVQYFYNQAGDRVEVRTEKDYLELLAQPEGTKVYITLAVLKACDAVDEPALTKGLFAASAGDGEDDPESQPNPAPPTPPTPMAKKRLAFDINAKTKDGAMLRIVTDKPEAAAGNEVFTVAEDDSETAAADGEVVIEGGPLDGTTLVVKGGKIETVTPASTDNGEGDGNGDGNGDGAANADKGAPVQAGEGDDADKIEMSAGEKAIMKVLTDMGSRLKTLEDSPLAQHAGNGGSDAFTGQRRSGKEDLAEFELAAKKRAEDAANPLPMLPKRG